MEDEVEQLFQFFFYSVGLPIPCSIVHTMLDKRWIDKNSDCLIDGRCHLETIQMPKFSSSYPLLDENTQ